MITALLMVTALVWWALAMHWLAESRRHADEARRAVAQEQKVLGQNRDLVCRLLVATTDLQVLRVATGERLADETEAFLRAQGGAS